MSDTHVAVSGITGFIGSYIAADLLRKGYTVHGTLRRNTPERIAHLPTDTSGTLEVFEADLLTPDGFDEATKGCKYAIHVASPYIVEVKDPQKDLVDPAIKGTLSFLGSCLKNGVEKVVITSSFAAITDRAKPDGAVFDESDWNETSSLKFLPYYFSKAEAERQAWKFAEENNMNIVTICPGGVFGPSMTKAVNESPKILLQIEQGTFGGIIDFALPCVDVRDVSEAHIRAMESSDASGRYICTATEPMFHVREITALLVQEGFKPPTRDLTNPIITNMIRFVSPFVPGGSAGQITNLQIGKPVVPSNAKITKDLDMKFITAEQSILDTITDLVKWGHLTKPESS